MSKLVSELNEELEFHVIRVRFEEFEGIKESFQNHVQSDCNLRVVEFILVKVCEFLHQFNLIQIVWLVFCEQL